MYEPYVHSLCIVFVRDGVDQIWSSKHLRGSSNTRLDYFLVSFGISNLIETSSICPSILTDHSLIKIVICIYTNKRGLGYWKFNCTLLRDPEYVKKIKSVVRETMDIEGDINVGLLWETLKLKIRTDTIQFSARKKRSKNNLFLALDKRLKRLEKEFHGNPTDEILEIIRLVRQDINDLLQEQINVIKKIRLAYW